MLQLINPVYRLSDGGLWYIIPSFWYSRSTIDKIAEKRRYRRSLNHKLCRLGIGRCYFLTRSAPYEKSKFLGSGGSMVARLKLKEIDGRAPISTMVVPTLVLKGARFLTCVNYHFCGVPAALLGFTDQLGTGSACYSRYDRPFCNSRKIQCQEWSLRLNLTQHGETHQVQTQ